jgi:hypothetical protein
MVMRDLTRDEIEEYLCFARSDTGAGDFHQDQTNLIAKVGEECGVFEAVHIKLVKGKALGLSHKELWIAIWLYGFQMGRECESRLITLALKGADPAAKAAGRLQ